MGVSVSALEPWRCCGCWLAVIFPLGESSAAAVFLHLAFVTLGRAERMSALLRLLIPPERKPSVGQVVAPSCRFYAVTSDLPAVGTAGWSDGTEACCCRLAMEGALRCPSAPVFRWPGRSPGRRCSSATAFRSVPCRGPACWSVAAVPGSFRPGFFWRS